MLEKIGTSGYEMLSTPDQSVMKYLSELLDQKPDPVFYEIGVGIGATTLAVAEALNNRGRLVLFSRETTLKALASDLAARGYHNIDSSWGSPSQVYSGYHFELACGFAEGKLPEFDLAYIDGGHVYHLDAPAACVLKELCRPGGYMIFDDWYWSLAKAAAMNPEQRPETAKEYDRRQIETCHIQLVCKTIMDIDARFERLGLETGSAVYRRRAE